MSNLMTADRAAGALRVPVWTRGVGEAPRFQAWAGDAEWDEPVLDEGAPEPAEPSVDLDELRQEAFAEGYAAGLAAGQQQADAEKLALRALAAGLEALKPEPTQALGALLAATVERLVRQVMGEVAIDPALLIARAEAAAALIGEETRPARLRLHPADLARVDPAALPVAVEPDPALAPGALRLETGSGWIEDGPEQRLETLRAQLDQIAAMR